MVVDSSAKHLRLSLVDGYSGYNHILMDEDDQEKTTFIKILVLLSYDVYGFEKLWSDVSEGNGFFISKI